MNSENQSSAIYNLTGATLIAQQGIFLVALVVLSTSINWPQSLGYSAEEAFPLITANRSAVFGGYYAYLLSSVLLIPMALCLRSVLTSKNNFLNLVLNVAVAFGIVAGAMKILGIIRWLFAMPMLAAAYLDTNANEVVREAAALNYALLNTYAGKLGEHIGVQLFTALFIGTIGYVILRTTQVASIFGWVALGISLLSFPYEDLLGIDLGLVIVSGVVTTLWTISLGVYMLTRARSLENGLLPVNKAEKAWM